MDVGIHFLSTACWPDGRYFLCNTPSSHAVPILYVCYSRFRKLIPFSHRGILLLSTASYFFCTISMDRIFFPAKAIQGVYRSNIFLRALACRAFCCYLRISSRSVVQRINIIYTCNGPINRLFRKWRLPASRPDTTPFQKCHVILL